MVSIADANAKVAKALTNMDRFDQIVNGDIDAVVTVDGGTVRSLRGIQQYGKAGPKGDAGASVTGQFAA